ncbi:MAG: hypothetical protein CVU11_07400 [Bacteroidetes bacterium HGW-Bacteroidetes-6]|jgi:hypothetical protein|nr:MAG: hypothetical protein CVU11_07400 [Bacteroidetes bacterium HGW-Bacteroidetes-6]
MKKIILIITVFSAIAFSANSQTLEKGSSLFNIGVGLGGDYSSYSGVYSTNTPAVGLSFDWGFKDDIGPGLITLGAYVGYKQLTYKHIYSSTYYYDWKWAYTIVGARSTYQYEINDKLSLYAGLLVSVNFVKFTEKSNDPYYVYDNYTSSNSDIFLTVFGGARYGFGEHFGAFAELGYGISYLTLGVGFKL